MNRALMNSLILFPSRRVDEPSPAQLPVETVTIDTEDGERLHAGGLGPASPRWANLKSGGEEP